MLSLLLLTSAALADSIAVGGSCQTNPCTVQTTWSYASLNITSGPQSIQGYVETSLDYPTPDERDPSLYFDIVIDTAGLGQYLTVDVYTAALSDECYHCEPSLGVIGLGPGQYLGSDVTEYADVLNPDSFELEGSVSTMIRASTDILNFSATWTDPVPAPEPPGWTLACVGLTFLRRLRLRKG